MSAVLWLLIALPLGGGAVLALTGPRRGGLVPAAGVAAAVATLGAAVAAALTRPKASAPLFAGMEAGLAVDGLSAVMVVTVAAVTTAVLAFAVGEFAAHENRGRFFGLMLLFAGAMLVTVTATTLPLLLMAWEVMGATSWALIGYWWRQPERAEAADVAFLTTRAADLGLYLAAGAAMAGGIGSLRLDALPDADAPWLHVITAGVVVAALGKSAALPFSFWLSRAMQGPSPVSALLHSATMVAAGAYLLLRLVSLLDATAWAGPLVAWTGAATALVLGLVAVAQTDLKQLLAASTSAQIGFMVLAAGSGGVAAGTTQLVSHAATKSALFLAAGAWLTALGTKQLPALRGAARVHPLVGVAFAVGALTLAGLPPLSLWAAKDEVLAAARTESTALYAVGLAAAAVAAVYSVKAVWYVTRPLPADAELGYDTEERGTRRVAGSTPAPLLALTFAAAVLGVLALPGPASWLKGLVGAQGEPSPEPWELGLSAAVALAAVGLAWRWASRPASAGLSRAAVRWTHGWLYLERAARLVVVRPVLGLARTLADFDDRVVDGAVRQTARGGLAAARLARRLDDGGIDAGVRAVATGARSLGRWARRPQTGLLHQYYAQAAAGFAVLVLIILLVR
ncbi:NADH-quinone oxidoreductase subunit 5 family protein [Streptomyces coelicoflavus]|uniref:NADH-quinone oxidoreductase subunit L n=2 Tax=Streptomyces TaxID=1883 RepID=A0A369UWN3_9ACTN|nr:MULTISPECIES: proton-conducting transporter membrane subunit [Streptomyces]MYS46234.1 NADH-quinone oxidoreductase subunit L [Streptomyces sp. SID5998]WDI21552.1 proton-conducting transporter membrane subunit [Streptomyces enissocaesilis]AIV33312.1 NADH dehydrogenase [Streptomyces sp. CCM_MD2014]MCT7351778.1 proton-conducting transporter membrane subunit [Streptomyces sp. 15-116A]MCW1097685.1 proton-conducting transporter membrane subunit [Streptomyces sp. RS2]